MATNCLGPHLLTLLLLPCLRASAKVGEQPPKLANFVGSISQVDDLDSALPLPVCLAVQSAVSG